MLSKRTRLAVLCAAAFAACDAADSISGPSSGPPSLSGGGLPIPPIETEFLPGVPELDPFAPMWNDDHGVVESARGGGHFQEAGALRTFAFTAKNRADGSTQGQWQVHNRANGVREHGVVTCLEVVDNRAWIGGTVTHSSDPLRVGQDRNFRVFDGGEGSGSQDYASLVEARPAVACHAMFPDQLRALDGGNIQVRDGQLTGGLLP